MKEMILAGFGGHARSVMDSIERGGLYRIIGYTDREEKPPYRGCRWLGTDGSLEYWRGKGVENLCLGAGYMGAGAVRDKLFDAGKRLGYKFPVIIDPSAVIAGDVSVGEGSFIGKNAVLNAGSIIGVGCIVNTGALVEHGTVVEDFSHIAVGVVLCGDVRIAHHCFIGAGATVIQGVVVESHALVGAGSTVLVSVGAGEKVCGLVRRKEQ